MRDRDISDDPVQFPVLVDSEHTLQVLLKPSYGYVNSEKSPIAVMRKNNDRTHGYNFYNPTGNDIKYVSFSKEPSPIDNWMWVKLVGEYLWPADGPADRMFAIHRCYRKS